jgi:exosortase/archaeosortase family protein
MAAGAYARRGLSRGEPSMEALGMETNKKAWPRWMLAVVLLLGGWATLVWAVRRACDGSDDNLGVLALLAAGVLSPLRELRAPAGGMALWGTASALALLLVARLAGAPELLCALPVAGGLSLILLEAGAPRAVAGLLGLSLPWMATLDFYLGYPLRVVTSAGSGALLQGLGLKVARLGTVQMWEGRTVVVDVPCSGLHSLWFGAFVCLVLAARFRLGMGRTAVLCAVTGVILLAGNVVRSTVLFFPESGMVTLPEFAHGGIGAVVFLAGAALVAALAQRWAGEDVACA